MSAFSFLMCLLSRESSSLCSSEHIAIWAISPTPTSFPWYWSLNQGFFFCVLMLLWKHQGLVYYNWAIIFQQEDFASMLKTLQTLTYNGLQAVFPPAFPGVKAHTVQSPLRIKAVVEPCGAMWACMFRNSSHPRCSGLWAAFNARPDTFHSCSIFTSSAFSCRDLWGQSCQAAVPKRLGAPMLASFILSHFHRLFSLLPLCFLWSFSRLISNYFFTAFLSFTPGGHYAQQRSLVLSVAIRCI